MATWAKEDVPLIPMRTWTTGSIDTSVHTVKLQPVDQVYPTGAIACSQCTIELWLWRPDADLDDDKHYQLYVDATKKDIIISRQSIPAIGG